MERSQVSLEHIVSLCKRRGFVFPAADIYGGINGVYDMGPLGTILRSKIRDAWLHSVAKYDDILRFEGSLLGPEGMWKASGHIDNFHDPLIDCLTCKKRFRADDIPVGKPCPHCGNTNWTSIKEFHLMFSTRIGASAESQNMAYLRPETAQSIFVNFKHIMSTNRVKIPFGVAQIGKAFRNEITPKQFLFRMREFEQMELEWFCKPDTALDWFSTWCARRMAFYEAIGIAAARIRIRQYEQSELSHYSQATSDIEYQFPFGWKEVEGIAYRGDFDLTQHMQHSGKDLSVFDEATKSSFVPHIVESSVGVDRLFLMVLFECYDEEVAGDEVRTVLRLPRHIAPVQAAFLPLVKNLSEPMERLFHAAKAAGFAVQFDETGSIGKRYRRQDEIGTPLCFTFDADSVQTGSVTVRDRDSMQQERIQSDHIIHYMTQWYNH